MAKDDRLYARFDRPPIVDVEPYLESAISFVSHELRHGFAYLVYWPKAGLMKAGYSSHPARYRKWARRGAILIGFWQSRGNGVHDEEKWQSVLERHGRRAFANREQSFGFTGNGAAWTEFYSLDEQGANDVLRLVAEVPYALVQD